LDILAQQLINGLILGSIYALIALGYTMVYGILGLINFAHGEIVMIGAMVCITCLNLLLGHAGDHHTDTQFEDAHDRRHRESGTTIER